MKKVAVLMSSFNGEKYIYQQIESILNQQLHDCQLELFIRDDGSSDKTIEIIKNIQNDHKNVVLFESKNVGYIRSFISLLVMMKHKTDFDYYSLSDQDDVWDTDKLQVAINCIEEKNRDNIPFLYQSTTRIVDEKLHFVKNDVIQKREITIFNSMIQTFSPGHTYVFNRALLDEVDENIDSSRLYGHDSYLTNLAVLRGRVFFDNTPHNLYRQHGNNQLGTNKSAIGWIIARIKRLKKGDSKRYAKQIKYLSCIFAREMDSDILGEFEQFFDSQKSVFTRLQYIKKCRLYRQTTMETIAFKLLYLVGGYNE